MGAERLDNGLMERSNTFPTNPIKSILKSESFVDRPVRLKKSVSFDMPNQVSTEKLSSEVDVFHGSTADNESMHKQKPDYSSSVFSDQSCTLVDSSSSVYSDKSGISNDSKRSLFIGFVKNVRSRNLSLGFFSKQELAERGYIFGVTLEGLSDSGGSKRLSDVSPLAESTKIVSDRFNKLRSWLFRRMEQVFGSEVNSSNQTIFEKVDKLYKESGEASILEGHLEHLAYNLMYGSVDEDFARSVREPLQDIMKGNDEQHQEYDNIFRRDLRKVLFSSSNDSLFEKVEIGLGRVKYYCNDDENKRFGQALNDTIISGNYKDSKQFKRMMKISVLVDV